MKAVVKKEMIIDIHTHVLPEVDDGAKDLQMSLEMLVESAKAGVKKVIATPHYYPWKENVSAEIVRQACEFMQEKLFADYGVEMEIYPGHEIFYSTDVLKDLKNGKVLTLANSRYVLLEFDLTTSFSVIYHAVREFKDSGYIPIIAHVERYDCLRSNQNIEKVKEGGALLQMNVRAVQGTIFSQTRRWSRRCLKNEKIDFLGSDMHNLETRPPYRMLNLQLVQSATSQPYFEKLLCSNCERILSDTK